MSGIDYGIVIVYLLGMIAVGLYFQRKASDYDRWISGMVRFRNSLMGGG